MLTLISLVIFSFNSFATIEFQTPCKGIEVRTPIRSPEMHQCRWNPSAWLLDSIHDFPTWRNDNYYYEDVGPFTLGETKDYFGKRNILGKKTTSKLVKALIAVNIKEFSKQTGNKIHGKTLAAIKDYLNVSKMDGGKIYSLEDYFIIAFDSDKKVIYFYIDGEGSSHGVIPKIKRNGKKWSHRNYKSVRDLLCYFQGKNAGKCSWGDQT